MLRADHGPRICTLITETTQMSHRGTPRARRSGEAELCTQEGRACCWGFGAEGQTVPGDFHGHEHWGTPWGDTGHHCPDPQNAHPPRGTLVPTVVSG